MFSSSLFCCLSVVIESIVVDVVVVEVIIAVVVVIVEDELLVAVVNGLVVVDVLVGGLVVVSGTVVSGVVVVAAVDVLVEEGRGPGRRLHVTCGSPEWPGAHWQVAALLISRQTALAPHGEGLQGSVWIDAENVCL